jgi:lipopolysaccharide transport protein LptA
MAISHPNPGKWLVAALILLGMGAPRAFAAAAAAEGSGCTEPVHAKSDNIAADYRQNNVDLRNVDISQCDVRVRAKNARAKGLNTQNAHWNFDGDVRIDVENRGNLRANEAEVEFRDNQISKLNITGTPAEFEQKRKDDAMARGHAQEIEYDVTGGTVRLANNAWLTDGRIDLKCAQIFYDIRQQSAKCPSAGTRVEITIPPMKPKSETPKAGEDKKEAPKAP